MDDRIKTKWLCADIPTMAYAEAWDLQGRLVTAVKEGTVDSSVVLLLEHLPVLTMGRRGGLNHLTVSNDFLKQADIQVFHVERGGDITFHGPGQLVMYPIFNLQKARMGVTDYVHALEEVMISTARDWNIEAGRSPINRGVWVGKKKLGSIGIAIRRGVCFHGVALNVSLALEPFQWIEPCGLSGVEMTSMSEESSEDVSMSEVRKRVKGHVETVFDVVLDPVALSDLSLQVKDVALDHHPKLSPVRIHS